MVLPIGVVLPTRNSMPHLADHLASMRAWAPQVQEIVVVDSDSEDGTPAYVRAHLEHPHLRIVRHPPGLFESWNHGTRQIESPFTYVSTVGDTITLDGLAHLHDVAESLEADVVVSPPAFRDERAEPLPTMRWPLHEMIAWLGLKEPSLVSPRDAFWFALYFVPGSILGSSASNLYRTATLQDRPFPTGCAGAGDTAWGVLHAGGVRLALSPREVSTFLVHAPSKERMSDARLLDLYDQLIEGARKAPVLDGADDDERLREVLDLLEAQRRAQADKATAKRALTDLRAKHALWFLRRDGVTNRWTQIRGRHRLRRLRERIAEVCAGALPARGYGDDPLP